MTIILEEGINNIYLRLNKYIESTQYIIKIKEETTNIEYIYNINDDNLGFFNKSLFILNVVSGETSTTNEIYLEKTGSYTYKIFNNDEEIVKVGIIIYGDFSTDREIKQYNNNKKYKSL